MFLFSREGELWYSCVFSVCGGMMEVGSCGMDLLLVL